MRNLLILIAVFSSTLGAVGRGSPRSKISQLPDGTLSGRSYSNDALGLRSQIPTGWIANAGPKVQVPLDDQKPDGPVNQCSKVLLWLNAPQQHEGKFSSIAAIFAIDPGCFPGAKFPKSLEDKKKILKFTDRIVKSFANTPFISHKGADVDAFREAGLLIIQLSGDEVINAVNGLDPATKEPLHVNISFCLAESNGYWVAWTVVADDPTAEELKKWNVQFKVR